MFSTLRNNLIYTDISPDIIEHDLDIDSDLWNYDGIDVYRGSFDPRYTSQNLQVYWLYDDNSNRVGLAEHEIDDPEIFQALWFKDTPFGTLFQEDGWKSKNMTLWSMISNEAFQDCLEDRASRRRRCRRRLPAHVRRHDRAHGSFPWRGQRR